MIIITEGTSLDLSVLSRLFSLVKCDFSALSYKEVVKCGDIGVSDPKIPNACIYRALDLCTESIRSGILIRI